VIALALCLTARTPFGGRTIVRISGIDSVCYFGTAHSLLFDRDFDLTNQFARLPPDPTEWTAVRAETGKPGSQFAIGFSLMQIPFLAAGYVASVVVGNADTLSIPVVLLYYIGLVFWTCLGLVLFQRLIMTMASEDGSTTPTARRIAAGLTLAIWPASTLCYYTFSPMAHVATFTASVIFLQTWWRAKDTPSKVAWLKCGAALGLLTLCRWQDVLFVAVPVVYDAGGWLRRHFAVDRGWFTSRAVAAAAFCVVIAPQLIQWKVIYGAWLAFPRAGVVFEFPPRHLLHALFSTQHGWFVWTPAAALACAGLLWACRRTPRVGLPLLAAVICEVWFVGSMQENWDGHVAFGMRYLTSTFSLAGAGLAIALTRVTQTARRVTLGLGAACAVFTLAFGVQYRLDLVPKRDRLTLDELFADKAHLPRALSRHRAAAAAKALIDQGHFADAATQIGIAKRAFGPGRELLQMEVDVYRRLGDAPGESAARAALDRLLASRLF
jgi:hypothetical protein